MRKRKAINCSICVTNEADTEHEDTCSFVIGLKCVHTFELSFHDDMVHWYGKGMSTPPHEMKNVSPKSCC